MSRVCSPRVEQLPQATKVAAEGARTVAPANSPAGVIEADMADGRPRVRPSQNSSWRAPRRTAR